MPCYTFWRSAWAYLRARCGWNGKGRMTGNLIVGFGGVGLLGLIAFLLALRLIRRDEARRRSKPSKQ